MSIGSRIYEARLEAGLSQRELAGDTITRNMLSLLEHDQANPSLETLRYLGERLGKKLSYFLEEDSVELPGLPLLQQARQAFGTGAYLHCLELLEQAEGGEILGPEREILWAQATLGGAEQALKEGRALYARTILERGRERLSRCPYIGDAVRSRMQLLLARSARTPAELQAAVEELPDLQEQLLLRARAALQSGHCDRAAALLDAAENRESPGWNILRGDAAFGLQDWEQALTYYQKAEPEAPKQVRRGLQLCYEKLRDFEKAYYYATMES